MLLEKLRAVIVSRRAILHQIYLPEAVSDVVGLNSLVLVIDGIWFRLRTSCDIGVPDPRRLDNAIAGAGTPT